MATPAAPRMTTLIPALGAARPALFRGYTLVALVAAWIAGLALRPAGPLLALTPLAWLLLAALCLVLWIVAGVVGRMLVTSSPSWRLWRGLLMLGMLGCCAALGAARAAAVDTRYDASSVALLATEPDVRNGYRYLTVDVSAASPGSYTLRPATGRIEAKVYGPDDWFSPASRRAPRNVRRSRWTVYSRSRVQCRLWRQHLTTCCIPLSSRRTGRLRSIAALSGV